MDKVDAKTRETAATLLDVLWTSKVAAEAARPSVAPALTGTSNTSTSAGAAYPVDNFPGQVATNNIQVIGNHPTTVAPRHGFDTNGWGNETTVKHTLSTQPITNKTIVVNSASNDMIDNPKKVLKQEHDTQTILQQQQHQQPQSSNAMLASSSASTVPTSAAHNQDHEMQYQSQEKLLKQSHCVALHQNQQPSTHLQQNNLLETNSTSITSNCNNSNTTGPMMISLTSIGFGIDNNNTSRVDATEATIKAVQDAMERSSLQFQTFRSHPLQIKIKLGVPSVATAARTSNNLRGSSDSKRTQSQIEMRPMNVDLARLSSILPRVIPILPVQVEVGGLFIPGENPGAPSICTVVACITLESQPQPSSMPQPQSKPSPRASIAPPLPQCPSLSSEASIAGSQKPKAVSVMELSSKAAKRMMNAPTQTQELQQLQQTSSTIIRQPMNLLPTSTSTFQERLAGDPVPPQQWPAGNSPEKTCVSETTALPSSSLLYRTQVTTVSAANPLDQIEKKTTVPISSNNCKTVEYTTITGQKRSCQQNQAEASKKPPPQVVRRGSNGTTNSIEILAMISEQEINRRNVIGTSAALKTTPSSTTKGIVPTLSAESPISDMHKANTRAGIVMADSRSTLQGVDAMGESRRNKTGDCVLRPEVSFVATRHHDAQTIGGDQSNGLSLKKNIKNEQKDGDTQLKKEGTFTASETKHFITQAFYKKKLIVEKSTSTTSTMCTKNLANSANVHQPQHLISRQSKKSGGSRVGGRSVSYFDYSNEHPLPEERDCWALSTRTTSSPVFPLKLHETLTQIEKDGFDDIIGWLPHGRSFKIHKQKEFADIILPRYFVMTKKSSFLRQLNLYSFNRFSAGTFDKGSYYHEKFLRGKKFLSRRMTRQKVNGNRIRSAGNPDEEPDLSMYPICRDDDININSKHRLSLPSTSSSSSTPSLIATSGVTGRVIVSTGSTTLSAQTASSQQSLMHAASTTSASDASVGGTISSRNGAVGASSFLRVL